MGAIEKLLSKITGKKMTEQDIEARLGQIEKELGPALTAAEAARAAHASAVLAMTSGEALDRARATATQTGEDLLRLEHEHAQLQGGLQEARAAKASAQEKAVWAAARKLGDARSDAMADLQKKADAFAEAMRVAVNLSNKHWDALPQKPPFHPKTYGNEVFHLIAEYLYGATDGQLGRIGLSPYVVRQRPSLVDHDREAQRIFANLSA